MGKKRQRIKRGRPQSRPARERPKGPPPRPARKPQPGFWQRLRRPRTLTLGLVGLAVVLVLGAGWLGLRATRRARPTPASPLSWSAPPAMAIDPTKQYTATIVTEKGDITLQLFADKASRTVNNFVFLARQGFYDGVTFHRVITGFMAQTGDRTGTGAGGPGYTFDDEFHPDLKHDAAGIVSMANSGPNTNGSQFFITYAPTPWLNGQHTIFGRVVAGMEVAEKLTPRNPDENPSTPGDIIQTVRITEG